jgi:hypothetical protein
VRLKQGGALFVVCAFGLNTSQVVAADVGELDHQGVSNSVHVSTCQVESMTYGELASHDSRRVLFKVDESKCYALWGLVSTL